jgi:hypothetical protein
MVGSWPCKVSSEVHINGRCVSEPFREDKIKMTATKPEYRKDLKRARLVLSKGHEVVGPGYSRVTSVAAEVTNKRGNSGNYSRVTRVSETEQCYSNRVGRVTRVSQNSNMDRQADRVSWDTWVSQNSSIDQQEDRVSQVTRVSPNSSLDRWTDWVSRVGDTEQKMGGSSWLLTRKAGLHKIWLTQKAELRRIWLTRKTGLRKARGARNRKK